MTTALTDTSSWLPGSSTPCSQPGKTHCIKPLGAAPAYTLGKHGARVLLSCVSSKLPKSNTQPKRGVPEIVVVQGASIMEESGVLSLEIHWLYGN